MKNARIYIQKAIRCFPGDQSLWFNLALIEQQIAQVLNEQPSEKRSIDALKNVLKDIEISARYYSAVNLLIFKIFQISSIVESQQIPQV